MRRSSALRCRRRALTQRCMSNSARACAPRCVAAALWTGALVAYLAALASCSPACATEWSMRKARFCLFGSFRQARMSVPEHAMAQCISCACARAATMAVGLCNTDGCAYSRKIRLARARTTGGRTGQRRRDRVVARLSSCVHLVGRVHHRLAGPAPACNKAHDHSYCAAQRTCAAACD